MFYQPIFLKETKKSGYEKNVPYTVNMKMHILDLMKHMIDSVNIPIKAKE
jgi:hypothetical protein